MVKIEAEVFARNTAGRALVENLGMRREAEIRRAVFKRGEWLDELTYGLVPEERRRPLSTSLPTAGLTYAYIGI